MGSIDRRTRVGAVVDRVFGDRYRLDPRCAPSDDPDARPTIDTRRPAFVFVGRFLASSEETHARSRATSLQQTKPFNTASPTLTIVKDGLRAPIQAGDLVTDQASSRTFTVTRVMDGQFGRLVLHLRSGPK